MHGAGDDALVDLVLVAPMEALGFGWLSTHARMGKGADTITSGLKALDRKSDPVGQWLFRQSVQI